MAAYMMRCSPDLHSSPRVAGKGNASTNGAVLAERESIMRSRQLPLNGRFHEFLSDESGQSEACPSSSPAWRLAAFYP
jgi:hypothetical protein